MTQQGSPAARHWVPTLLGRRVPGEECRAGLSSDLHSTKEPNFAPIVVIFRLMSPSSEESQKPLGNS